MVTHISLIASLVLTCLLTQVQEMAQDQTGSRVLEVVIAIAPSVPGLLDELINRYFKGRCCSITF
jgi:hypothetical protein